MWFCSTTLYSTAHVNCICIAVCHFETCLMLSCAVLCCDLNVHVLPRVGCWILFGASFFFMTVCFAFMHVIHHAIEVGVEHARGVHGTRPHVADTTHCAPCHIYATSTHHMWAWIGDKFYCTYWDFSLRARSNELMLLPAFACVNACIHLASLSIQERIQVYQNITLDQVTVHAKRISNSMYS